MRVYTATYKVTNVTTALKTLMYFEVPTDLVVQLMSAEVSAPDDDTNEQMDIGIKEIGTLGTPTATTVTPAKHEKGDAASSVTVKADITASEPTYTANTDVGRIGATSLGGWRHEPSPDERLIMIPGSDWGILLNTGLDTDKDLTVRVTYAEIG